LSSICERARALNRMPADGKALLKLGAGLNFAIAAVHLGVIVAGAPAYLYFGAAGLAALARAGSPVPALLTAGLALAFIIFGLYGLSGAGVIRPLPLGRAALAAIGGVYTLRGMIVIFDLMRLARGAGYPLRQTVFSAVALAIGLIYLSGAMRRRPSPQA
jgi:hypothetical protein